MCRNRQAKHRTGASPVLLCGAVQMQGHGTEINFQKYIDYEKQDEYKDLVEKIGKYRESINKVILNSRVVNLKEEVKKIEKILGEED